MRWGGAVPADSPLRPSQSPVIKHLPLGLRLTLAIGRDTLLVEDKSGVATGLKLSGIEADDRLWLSGRKQVGAEVDAILAVVAR